MKTRRRIVRLYNKAAKKSCISSSRIYRDPKCELEGGYFGMNLNVDITLSDKQLKLIEDQTRIELEEALESGKLDNYIRETVKSIIKQIVNEEIQTKNYRARISDKVTRVLLDEGIIEEETYA